MCKTVKNKKKLHLNVFPKKWESPPQILFVFCCQSSWKHIPNYSILNSCMWYVQFSDLAMDFSKKKTVQNNVVYVFYNSIAHKNIQNASSFK